ncbi:MAG: excinuclease ABC subunit C [Bacteroidales bacterium]|nr:excinuclease ABC subunit C [Bacteroidales bacterium]
MTVLYNKYTPPDYIHRQLLLLPEQPGIYKFLNKEGKIIYVGKAKNLKKRVASYFSKNPDNAKLAVLVRKIDQINHLVVDTESDALLLENNLIKKHQPRYNVLLKDDKTFPWICIKNEPFPRVFTTRNIIRDGSQYFGPYTSGRVWKSMIELIRSMYKIRTCSLNLDENSIKAGKYKVCLEYHLGNCLGPCIGKQTPENYNGQTNQIAKILKGNTYEVLKIMKVHMNELASEYQYELAENIKERIEMLKRFQAKSTIVSNRIRDVDVFSIVTDDNTGFVNFLKVVNGAVIQTHSLELKKKLNETTEELLLLAIVEMRTRVNSLAKEIVVSHEVKAFSEKVKIIKPKRGDKKTLLDLSMRNAKYFRLEQQKKRLKHLPATRSARKLEVLQKDLRMKEMPTHIECFDNSNTQGSEPVAACVVFKNGRPSKQDYRHFNIKTVEGQDDYASMTEVIYRRYKRLLDEKQTLPQLVIIDGGKGQLSAAMKSIENLGLRGEITLIGIAKRLEEIYFPNDTVALYLDKNSESLKLIQQLRNEAHRFGITHHRQKRSKAVIMSELTNIKGIGEVTKDYLLVEFGSIELIKQESLQNLTDKVGKVKATLIFEYFREQQ